MNDAPASVWLLEDSRLEAALAQRVLGEELAVEWFTDGETLLEQLAHRRPSVLVLDASLPGISGLEVCRFVRGAFDEITLPVLFLTAHESQADVVDVLAAGANDYVRKPYDGAELKARVRTLVRLVKANEKRQTAETRAATGEQRLRELLVQAPAAIAIWRGPQHVFALANARCERLLGRSDLVGRTLRHVFPELEGQGLFEIFDEVWATGVPFYTGDYRTHSGRNGEGKSAEHFYAFNLVPTHDDQGAIDGLMAVAVDVTDVARARQGAQDLAHALAANVTRAQLAADVGTALTADNAARASLATCAQAIVRHLDVALARIWTLAPGAEVLELQASAGMYTHIDGPHARVPVGALKIGLIAQERAPHLTNDVAGDPRIGDKEWARREGMVAFAGYPLLVDQRVVGVVALFAREPLPPMLLADLAAVAHVIALGIDRAYAEAERARLLVSEREARLQAERSNRAKDEFLAVVSHELRTPLNAVLGWARLLSDGKARGSLPPDAARRGLETIERNALAQAQLIEDLLDVSRITMGKLRLEVASLSLVRVIEAAIESVRPAAAAKDLKLDRLLDPMAGPMVGDASRLQQLIWNLLSNAIKFTPRRGQVSIVLRRLDAYVELSVIDTGQGISAAFLPRVFERFEQQDASSTRAHGGLGLGLAICRHIVELHGGTIRVQSPGQSKGATFIVELPVEALHATASSAPASPRPLPARPTVERPPELLGLKVLVVDDDVDTRELVALVLTRCGAMPAPAASAEEALAALEREHWDVLLSDVGMPGKDGYALIRRVRSRGKESGGRIPAAALTAYARAEDRLQALDAGYQMHIPKPVEPAELVTVVAALARIGSAMRQGPGV
jgi:signal transduction histidine kinase/DNA-binding response OmpR family regulator